MKYFAFFLCLFLPTLLAAQACDYDKLYREGKTFAKQRQYKKALYKFNSARRCDPAKGETVDAAIEALLDQVEGEKKAADKALEDLKKTSGKVVESLLHDAENEVYHLRYAEALEKMNAAAEIGQKKPQVARALMEIAFFYGESGRFSEAKDITNTVAKLLGKEAGLIRIDAPDSTATRRAFRQVLQGLDPARYIELEVRYFPNMIQVEGGEADIDHKKAPVGTFQIARTETTFWQFALYAAAAGRKFQDFSPTWGLDGDNPAVNVTWYDATLYANWLSKRFGLDAVYALSNKREDDYDREKYDVGIDTTARGYRLPTEVEWEYAARSGPQRDTFVYSGTTDRLADFAWYDENSDTLGIRRTRPGSTRLPNGLGLRDMSGNVWEWCGDWYANYPVTFPANYRGPDEGSDRVYRGSCWLGDAQVCRADYRNFNPPDTRDYALGFRLALSLQ